MSGAGLLISGSRGAILCKCTGISRLFFFLALIVAAGRCWSTFFHILAFSIVPVHGFALVFLGAHGTFGDFDGLDHHHIVTISTAAIGASGDTSGNEQSHCRQHESFFHNISSSFNGSTIPPLFLLRSITICVFEKNSICFYKKMQSISGEWEDFANSVTWRLALRVGGFGRGWEILRDFEWDGSWYAVRPLPTKKQSWLSDKSDLSDTTAARRNPTLQKSYHDHTRKASTSLCRRQNFTLRSNASRRMQSAASHWLAFANQY